MDARLIDQVAADIRGWERSAGHRTGTPGDLRTAEWLADALRDAGLSPALRRFGLRRWSLRRADVRAGERAAGGIPLFDGGTTGPDGVVGRLAALPGGGIGLACLGAAAGEDNQRIAAARAADAHPALVTVAKMNATLPGLALRNADRFNAPFGPPVLQVDGACEPWLRELAAAGRNVRVTIDVAKEAAHGVNVEAVVRGAEATLAPLAVLTPKSAWWQSTAERGGGIAAWLALARRFAAAPPRRDVIFLATSGHELGHLGLAHGLAGNARLGRESHAWFHLGANFAAWDSRLRLQASDADMLALARRALAAAGESVAAVHPVGERPNGEARDLHDAGARYVSFLGDNPLFHHPADAWPHAVDVLKAARATQAALDLAAELV